MKIHKILHSLSEPYKEVFSLRVLGVKFYADWQFVWKTDNWACVTFHRARNKIREEMRIIDESTCNVIKDVLPLYLENMLSDDSCIMVEEHIEQCQDARIILMICVLLIKYQ